MKNQLRITHILILFSLSYWLDYFQVSALAKEFKREELTVWGNRSDVITNKCYAEVSVKISKLL